MFNQYQITDILKRLLDEHSEDEVTEFKEAKSQFDFEKLGKYFSALCNEANLKNKLHSWLIFGVKDSDKTIVGSTFRSLRSDLDKLKAEIGNHTSERITFIEIYELSVDEKRIVLFQIPAAPIGIPVAWKGHYYGRDGEELHPLNIEEVERIRRQSSATDWSSEIISDAELSDLSTEAIGLARENFKTKNPRLASEIAEWSVPTFLNKAKLTIKGQLTRTAILLLGKPEANHLLGPSTSTISWILRDRDNIEKDYEHFSCPLILSTTQVYSKIRNLTYRYLTDGSLFPEEVEQYDPYLIRETLNNCIAHQDYSLKGKVILVEHEDGRLVFINSGKFIPNSVEEVVISDAPEPKYRNPFLVEAMINLNMIDAIGSGIKRMFYIQKRKFFPLPDYEFANNSVKLTITGKVVDLNYARKLATMPELSLTDIIGLDKVAKNRSLSDDEIRLLKSKHLIEGRKPSFHISASVADVVGNQADYIKQRGIDDEYCQKIILDYLHKFNQAKRTEFEKILLDKLPDVLDDNQKRHKIKNNLQKLRTQGRIFTEGKIWRIVK